VAIALILALTIMGFFGAANASPASANTPSTWSSGIAHTSITFGWTNDHAWVISNYADAIAYGAGFIAGQACAALIHEEGPFIGKACSGPVTTIVKNLLQGHPRLTNHGLWAAIYLNLRVTGGTW
jgi:hypothetical protein